MAKLNLQQDWIRDLTEQNEMLVRAVEELEQEATERVLSLEEKLKQSSKSACEVMNGYKNISINLEESFRNVDNLQSDVLNLVEFVRRIREEGCWSVHGLSFNHVNKYDLIANARDWRKCTTSTDDNKIAEELKLKEQKIKELEKKLQDSISKDDECQKLRDPTYIALKQSMLDMRDALTAEVADKHDMIISLKRDVQLLEEQCRKADQQTHFKDDIIKELRKEIKQLKQERKKKHKLTSPRPSKRPNSLSPLRFRRQFDAKVNKPNELGLYDCPIPFHNTIEKYKDFRERVVIFVCEDLNNKEVHRVYDGSSMEVTYRNPKVVHEYKISHLRKMNTEIIGDHERNSSNVTSKNLLEYEHPEKLVEDTANYKPSELLLGCFEVVNSHPPVRTETKIVCQYPPSDKHFSYTRRNLDSYLLQNSDDVKTFDCYTCLVESPVQPRKSKCRTKFTAPGNREDLEDMKTFIGLKQNEHLRSSF